jgi:hypothetical protein
MHRWFLVFIHLILLNVDECYTRYPNTNKKQDNTNCKKKEVHPLQNNSILHSTCDTESLLQFAFKISCTYGVERKYMLRKSKGKQPLRKT